MKPTRVTFKVDSIENLLTEINGGLSRQEASRKGICTSCRGYVTGFKDRLSEVEYSISGLCQKCQDRVFGS